MADTPKRLVVPGSRVVSIDEAKRDEAKRRTPERAGDLLTRRDAEDMMKEFAARMSVSMSERIHADLVQQSQAFLQEMEMALQAHIDNEIFRRSWYGRFRALLIRLGAKPKGPKLVEPEDEIVEEEEAPTNGGDQP